MTIEREIIETLATQVMGWKKTQAPDCSEFWNNGVFCGGVCLSDWNPLQNIADAQQVLDKLDDGSYHIEMTKAPYYDNNIWIVEVSPFDVDEEGIVHIEKRNIVEANSLQEAICKAAVEVVA